MGYSVGVIIHNEERNIGRLLGRLETELQGDSRLERVVVVSSASTDRSDSIVREAAARWPAVRLVVETERRGKASAINLFLDEARSSEACILLSGDVLPDPGALAKLLDALADPGVGMAAGRPVPLVSPHGIAGRIARLQWDLHHEVSLRSPKLGEVVAFRNVVDRLPADTAVDEASLEAILCARGFRLAYVPDAIIRNKAPDNVRDLLKQRRRIAAGHGHLRSTRGYSVSTTRTALVAPAVLRFLAREPSRVGTAAMAATLEAWGRLLGWWDLRIRGKNPYVWEIATSTKDPGDATPPRPPAPRDDA